VERARRGVGDGQERLEKRLEQVDRHTSCQGYTIYGNIAQRITRVRVGRVSKFKEHLSEPMPKTKKRASSKRAARIARAHATELPKLEVKEPQQRTAGRRQKAPARGIARYPWATALTIALIALSVYLLYVNHLGPFALPPRDTKLEARQTATAMAASAQKTATALTAAMPKDQYQDIAYSQVQKSTAHISLPLR
jgi:hypothetical protein